ncbi:MAG: type II toxin-antitoxin system RelB/DinJ family antitoxin [Candidatus Faecousia sp.]|nr:type II toxin-antitoxin system RelB/DinJ family antitoxin [Bacillota bacterium]MDY4755441.1 type II toxin-antitoxin system RelB/DinJ family antitoxin [Candidatus Faecousia sp.]MDY6160810.1 type II toxin-antitoxin system RelB/DinJ family antitoxin [Candidatus Faecousia sp.]
MENPINVATAPKTGTFQMRMNPQVRQEAEAVFARYGLSLTDAVNIFLQQSLNESGLPFLLSPENAEYMKAKAAARLKAEIQKGWESVQTETDWVDEKDAYRMLGVEE